MDVEDSAVAERLRMLEVRFARLAFTSAVAGAILVAAVVWLTVRTPKTLKAQHYVLMDSGGRPRGEWGPSGEIAGSENGKPMVASITCLVMRSQGRSRASLCAPWDEPGIDASLSLAHSTGSKASVFAGALMGQVILSSRTDPTDRRSGTVAVMMASHVDANLTLRHKAAASSWSSSGLVPPSTSADSPRE